MAVGNVIVTKTVNRTTFEVDKGAYAKTLRAIKKVKKEWEGAGNAISQPKNNPAKAYDKSAREMRLVSKRLEETRRKEQEKSTNHAIAMAKREARAKEAIQKQSAARIKQTVQNMTAKNPEAARMRRYYQEQEKSARAAARSSSRQGGGAGGPTPSSGLNISRINSAPLPPRGGNGTGMVGSGKIYNPAVVARQNAAMANQNRLESRVKDKRAREAAREARSAEREQRRAAARSARIEDVTAQQSIRLSSRYGSNYHQRLGRGADGNGIQELNNKFKQGALSAGQYRQSVQALERQFKAAQGSAAGFGSVLNDVRGNLTSMGAAYGVFAAGSSVLKQGQFFQGLDATMALVSDNSEEAGKRIQFVRDQSMRLGLSLKEAAQGYVQMSVSAGDALDKGGVDSLFKGYSEYATALQVDPIKYQRGITALQQMLGKGQIMAEELKGQLAEAIPGSMQVFVKAAQEAFGDSTIDVEKLMDMMKNSELTAKKVMPFIAKYYAEAANKGGALTKALNGNRVAMQRLQQTWINFQNEVFEGGFGEQMTRVFNDLAQIVSSNGELSTALGAFFGNMIDGAWDAVTLVHNAFVFLDRVLGYYIEKWGGDGEILKKVFEWGAYAAGVGIFIGTVTKLFNILSKIAGLGAALAVVRGAVGGAAAAAGGAAAGAAGAAGAGAAGGAAAGAAAGGKGLLKRMVKGGLSIPALIGGQVAYEAVDNINTQVTEEDDSTSFWDSLKQRWNNGGWANQNAMNMQRRGEVPTINTNTLAQNAVTQTNPFPYPLSPEQQQMNGNITIEIKAGDLKRYIKTVVDENDRLNFNMLTQGGPG